MESSVAAVWDPACLEHIAGMKDPGSGETFASQLWLQVRISWPLKSISGHTHVNTRASQRPVGSPHVLLQG